MKRDQRLLDKRIKQIGLFMELRKAAKDYTYDRSIIDIAQMLTISPRVARMNYTAYNKLTVE